MTSLASTRRVGATKHAVWSDCDSLLAAHGREPRTDEVASRHVEAGASPNSVRSWISQWRAKRREALEPDRSEAEPGSVAAVTLAVGPDGRLSLPPETRQAMLLPPDGRVAAEAVDGEFRVIAPMAAIRRIQRIAQKDKKPGVSIVDEFLAERRAMWREQ